MTTITQTAATASVTNTAAALLARWSVPILRITVGAIFVLFALPKIIPGASPVESLVVRTVDVLSFGLVPAHLALGAVAALELFIGITLITGKLVKLGLLAMLGAAAGFFAPFVLFPGELFGGGITLEAQYILKDVVLLAAGLVIAAVSFGARLGCRP